MKYLQLKNKVQVSGGFETDKAIAFITEIRINHNLAIPQPDNAPPTPAAMTTLVDTYTAYVDLVYYKSIEDFQNGEMSIYVLGSSPFQLVDVEAGVVSKETIYEVVAPKLNATVKTID